MANTPAFNYRFFDSEISEMSASEFDEYDIILPLNHELPPSIGLLGYLQIAGILNLLIILLVAPYFESLSGVLLPEPAYGFAFSK